ncbi:unnamed protein product [Amaranthus hypochondriacus]
MSSERELSERRSAEKLGFFKNANGRSRRTVPANKYSLQPRQPNRQAHHRFPSSLQQKYPPSSVSLGGNRGLSHPPWGCGPREPRTTRLGGRNGGAFTIFVDGLSSSATVKDLRSLGEKFGPVVDAFISRKERKNTKLAFGFVRYNHGDCAKEAITKIHGQDFFGLKLRVSWAKYGRDGRPVQRTTNNEGDGVPKTRRPILSPALRDNRRYSEVVIGTKNPGSTTGKENMEEKAASFTEKNFKDQVILNVLENPVMVKNLKLAVVIEIEQHSDSKKIEAFVSENEIDAVCLSSLSPNKLVLFLEDELNMERVLEDSSPLRKFVVDVRKWSEDEQYRERLVWIECVGVHPNCSSFENFEKMEIFGDAQ